MVVIGAGFAGLAAVRALPTTSDWQITLVDRRNHHLFQALLYQVASAGLNPSEIASPVRAIFRDRANVRVLMGEMTDHDAEARQVVLDEGEVRLDYDYLVLAVGGQTSFFGHPEWSEHAYGLKSIEEALAIRKRVLLAFETAEKTTDPDLRRRLMTIAVVGGGPTGVELSGAFAELRSHVLRWDFRSIDPQDARIVLIEGGDRLISFFPEDLCRAAQTDLEALGVEVWLGERVTSIGPGQLTTTNRQLEAHTVVWAGGIEGVPLASKLGYATNARGQILTGADLRVAENVFCLGDMASLDGLPAMAPVAMQQGRHAGQNLVLLASGQATLPFVYHDEGIMATVGRTRGVALLDGRRYTGTRGWATWLYHHLLRIVDFQNRVLVTARWAWAYVAWKWGVRLVYGEDEK
ncbi:MAG: NAD(P)/FAD-dependent oxidoreductase [Candidatus Eremiobacteraeota bacterium]|nr:NAD(P)/FAD-dependent oxidoreductase [Candidatus Eremiobacteraeota bacterium]